MSTLYIHIGTWKTGSSTIQYNLNKEKERLRNKGYVYLSKEEKIVIDDSIIRGFGSIESDFVERSRNKLKGILEKYRSGNGSYIYITSAEEFSGDPFKGFTNVEWVAKNLYEITKGFDLTVKIIVYVRRQDDFAESMYTQSIRLGESHSFLEYINGINAEHFNWLHIADSYAGIFGKENIIVRRYHKTFLPRKESLIKDFMSVIGYDEYFDFPDTISKNRGFNRDVLEILRITNKQLDEDSRKALRKIFHETGSKKPYESYSFFSDDLRRDFLRMYNESNSELATNYLNTNEPLFPDPVNQDPKESQYEGLTDEAIIVNFSKALLFIQNQSNEKIKKVSKVNRNRFYRFRLKALFSRLYKKHFK